MRANTESLLTLFEWGQIVGINPFELAQIADGYPLATDQHCPHVFYQRPWHRDYLSRDEVVQAINAAEEDLATHLGYWPAPKYIVGESPRYPRPANRVSYGNGVDIRGQWKPIKLRWKYVHGGGRFARTLIEAGRGVAPSDSDGDGVDDRFTVTVNTTITDPDEIALYFTSTDRMGAALDETWRIRPLNVSIASGVATITGHIAQMVEPARQEGTNPQRLNATDAIYVVAVDVYRVYRDTTATNTLPQQGNAEWDLAPDPDPTGVVETQAVILGAYDTRLGFVTVQIPSCWPQAREPDKLSLNYLAGISLENGRMNSRFARIVAYLSLNYLAREQCGCERSSRIINYWRMWPSDFNERARPLSITEIDAPFGPSRGGRYAWEQIQQLGLDV